MPAANRGRGNPNSKFDTKGLKAISPNWARWVKTFRNTAILILAPSQKPAENGSVLLYFPAGPNGRNPLAVNLTDLTIHELDALETLFLESFKLARPIVVDNDRIAEEKNRAGDDSDQRTYRRLPEVVVRPWAESVDAESILQRLAYVPDSGGLISGDQGNFASPVSAVDRGVSLFDLAEDLPTEDDDPQGTGTMDGSDGTR